MLATTAKNTLRQASRRFLSSSSNGGAAEPFRPRRRPNRNYRPLTARGPSKKGPRIPLDFGKRDPVELGNFPNARDELERDFGPEIADALRDRVRAKRLGKEVSTDEFLQMADYMTAAPGTLEEKQGERRAMALDAWDEDDRDSFMEHLDDMVEKARVDSLGLGDIEYKEDDELGANGKPKNAAMAKMEEEIEEMEEEVDDNGDPVDPLQLAHGQW
jgi:hypothetical protein